MKRTALLILMSFSFLLVTAQQKYWQQQVNYTITVTLNDKEHTLDGNERMEYVNNSGDTLRFIWIHLWPNAYKNDRTAFSDQTLENGSTNFYFSDEEKRGYINRLSFKVDGTIAAMEDHPQHLDIIKLRLNNPLAPGKSCLVETPFHVKLPYNFSRGGHLDQSYQITQWYPKAAVYDKNGWHEMPYVDQGEYYNDFGNYDVAVTLPSNYVVAATGELIKESTGAVLSENALLKPTPAAKEKKSFFANKKAVAAASIPSAATLKTWQFKQNNVTDFAWFADKRFTVQKDTLLLPSGRIINVAAYSIQQSAAEAYWKNALKYIKKTVLTRSRLLGEYPYNNVTAVQAETHYGGGMEYPTITLISGVRSDRGLEGVIEHEVGHNWLQGILSSNEREHPWMDEGMNSYYDNRYVFETATPAANKKTKSNFIQERMPLDYGDLLARTAAAEGKDQPIETSSEKLSSLNYGLSAYYKASQWMKWLESSVGTALFDSCMRQYFNEWKFKHPNPEDFKAVIERVSGKNLSEDFSLLSKKGITASGLNSNLKKIPKNEGRKVKLTSLFSFKETNQYKYIFVSPAVGFNTYDKFMIGALLHNYTLPAEKFQFLISPLYATGSKQWNGIARMDYTLHKGNNGSKLSLSLAGASFNGDAFTDSTGKKNFMRYNKVVPGLKYIFANNDSRSRVVKYLQWKTFFIAEQSLQFTRDTINQVDVISYPIHNRYVNQLQFVIENDRVLYPYKAVLQADQGSGFVRLGFTGNYFFNYAKGGGVQVRLFAGKFFYLGEKTYKKQYETDAYQLNLSGPKGYEDYTYSNYFIGRNEYEKFASQQLMERDGFFKVRTDYLSSKIGKSDNWLAAANFSSTIPESVNPLKILPSPISKIPLKVFVDLGTFAEAWQQNAGQGKFLYDAGLQVSLFKETINVYVPLLYSKVYNDYFQSTITGNKFLKNIAFTINFQNLSMRKLFPQFAF